MWMLKRKLLFISFFIILFIAVFHFFAIKNSWYWTYRWLDIPVHIVGGFWVSLTVLWVCLKIKHIDNIYGYKKKALFVVFFSVFFVAVSWELFELVFKITSLDSVGYFRDSLSDIFNSVIGGIFAYYYFVKSKNSSNCLIENVSYNLPIIFKHE